MQALYSVLKKRYGLGELYEQRPDLAFVDVPKDQLRALIYQLAHQDGYTHLVLLTAVDWLEDGEFQLTYLVHNRTLSRDLGLRVRLPREDASMDTVHDIWPTAATYQRELREMFGINFPESPGVMDDFILEGWQDKPPYRRDFDTLEYAEANYKHRPGRETHDPARYMKKQLYPDGA